MGVGEMVCCLIKIVTKPYKHDEFVQRVHSLTPNIREQRSCLDYSVYQDFEKKNIFSLIGEWNTRQAMETHLQSDDFEMLIGVIGVLGREFTMHIAEVSKSGSFELAREMIKSKKQIQRQ